jgi:hypothetical protein
MRQFWRDAPKEVSRHRSLEAAQKKADALRKGIGEGWQVFVSARKVQGKRVCNLCIGALLASC